MTITLETVLAQIEQTIRPLPPEKRAPLLLALGEKLSSMGMGLFNSPDAHREACENELNAWIRGERPSLGPLREKDITALRLLWEETKVTRARMSDLHDVDGGVYFDCQFSIGTEEFSYSYSRPRDGFYGRDPSAEFERTSPSQRNRSQLVSSIFDDNFHAVLSNGGVYVESTQGLLPWPLVKSFLWILCSAWVHAARIGYVLQLRYEFDPYSLKEAIAEE